jgi:hypothetical protein
VTRFKVPTWFSIALSVLAGVLQLLNLTTFGFAPTWQELVTVGVSALAAVGIAPLTGPALQTVLHISHAASLSLASLFATASVAVTTVSGLDQTAKGLIVGVLALIGGVLFGGAGPSVPVVPPPAPVPPVA